jgi:hypothetical protein
MPLVIALRRSTQLREISVGEYPPRVRGVSEAVHPEGKFKTICNALT